MAKKQKNIMILLGTTGLIYFGFRYLLPLVVPFVFAVILAKTVTPAVEFLKGKLHIPRKIAVVVVLLGFFGTLVLFLWYGTTLCFGQLQNFIKTLPRYSNQLQGLLGQAGQYMDAAFDLDRGASFAFMEKGIHLVYVQIQDSVGQGISGFAWGTFQFFVEFFAGLFIFVLALLMILFHPGERGGFLRKTFLYEDVKPVVVKMKETGFAYLRTQGIIMAIVAVVTMVGLLCIGNPYAAFMGVAVALVDAFPVLGSGSILIPWAVLRVMNHDFYGAAVLFTIFIITMFVRELLEPKLMGRDTGMNPLYILASVYVGVQVFGIGGIVLGPIGLTVLKAVAETRLI